MTESDKKEIQMLVKSFCEQYPSQAKAVGVLKSVSEATIINIRKGEWESISDEMWRTVGKQVGFNNAARWKMVETQDFKTLCRFFDDAREYGNVFAITAKEGWGKSFAAEYYASKKPTEVFVVSCADYFNRRDFLEQLLLKMGKGYSGLKVAEMMDLIVSVLMKKETALIIMDEFDKVPDNVLYFFITLYNRLEGHSGLIMMATDHLSKRIMRGRRMNRKGYSEIFSRIGRRFISLKGTTPDEVEQICRANGVTDREAYTTIYNDCEGDLRRVKRGVHKVKVKAKK
jgi:Cdc6-like AAA superfamily ATPase